MTDAPRTLSLSPDEWRTLIDKQLQTFANRLVPMINPAEAAEKPDVGGIIGDLDRLKLMLVAWRASMMPGPPLVQETASLKPVTHATNGQAKRKPGWPLGKPRGPRVRQQPREFPTETQQ